MKIFMNEELECKTDVSIDEMKAQYRYRARILKKEREKINEELLSLEKMITQAEKNGDYEILDELTDRLIELKSDKETIGWLLGNLEYSLEWMETCRRPGNKRGIERRAAYQREKPMDPLIMQRYIEHVGVETYPWMDRDQRDAVTLEEREKIESVLSVLTNREREAYLMVRGNCLSFSETAKLLGVTKSRVQDAVKRAETKIAKKMAQEKELSLVS